MLQDCCEVQMKYRKWGIGKCFLYMLLFRKMQIKQSKNSKRPQIYAWKVLVVKASGFSGAHFRDQSFPINNDWSPTLYRLWCIPSIVLIHILTEDRFLYFVLKDIRSTSSPAGTHGWVWRPLYLLPQSPTWTILKFSLQYLFPRSPSLAVTALASAFKMSSSLSRVCRETNADLSVWGSRVHLCFCQLGKMLALSQRPRRVTPSSPQWAAVMWDTPVLG